MATLGRVEEIEFTGRGGYRRLRVSGEVIATDTGRELRIVGFPSCSLLDAMRLGWRPWRRSIGRVHSLTYRTKRFLGPRGLGYLHGRRAAELARRWGAPAYVHGFSDARLMVDFSGRLRIRGSFEVGRLRSGVVGMIRG